MLAFPYFLVVELLAPFLDILGLAAIITTYIFGLLNMQFFVIYLLVYMGYSMIITWVSILLDKYLFGKKRKQWGDMVRVKNKQSST
jgi:uncharacterized membrane protein YagU involved in acid resistance